MSIRVVVADEHEVVRTGLVSLFKGTAIKIVGEAVSTRQAVSQTVKHKPDVVLLDIRLNGGDGLAALTEIRKKAPKTSVIVISNFDTPTYVARSVALGANDYILKKLNRKQLVAVITSAANGKSPTQIGLMRHVADQMSKQDGNGDFLGVSLTGREVQVLRHLGFGLSNREIGKSLGISVETVKEHVQNILRKLDLGDRTQAAVWAVRRKLA